MMKATKILSVVLAGLLTLPLLASCSNGAQSADSTGDTTQRQASSGDPTQDSTSKPSSPALSEKAATYTAAFDDLMQNIIADYYNKRTHTLNSEPRSGQSVLWGFGSFLEALADWYHLCPDSKNAKTYYVDALDNGLKKYRVSVARLSTPGGSFSNVVYYNAGAGGNGDFYYDDNAWICYQLLNAYVQLGDEKYLTEAKALLEFFKTGWDDKLGGGIYWDKTFGGKNTCENGPIAICFLWAHQLTGEADYLEWGKKIYDWTNETLKDDDLYCDSIGLDGGKNTWKADYNQGTPLYASCLLYEITKDEAYLDQAKKTATKALGLAFSAKGSARNPVIEINNNPIYKSWCVGWLMRGFEQYVKISGKAGSYFKFMEEVLDKTLEKKDSKGYYDPYFGSSGWDNESRTDVLQPCGVASVIAICARYEIEVAPNVK